jgi:hypothetical protein
LHLLVEATSKSSLSRAMGGLAVRVARQLNRRLGRRGSVFSDRFHSRALRTPIEVRRALVYVLNNHRKHAHPGGRVPLFDPCSSAPYFDGFSTAVPAWFRHSSATEDPPVVPARTWLLRVGWRRSGPLQPNEVPA